MYLTGCSVCDSWSQSAQTTKDNVRHNSSQCLYLQNAAALRIISFANKDTNYIYHAYDSTYSLFYTTGSCDKPVGHAPLNVRLWVGCGGCVGVYV